MTTTNLTTITVRELKAYASSYLRRLQETPNLEIIITRHGKPCAKLVALSGQSTDIAQTETISLRDTWADLIPLSDQDFNEAKGIWELKTDV